METLGSTTVICSINGDPDGNQMTVRGSMPAASNTMFGGRYAPEGSFRPREGSPGPAQEDWPSACGRASSQRPRLLGGRCLEDTGRHGGSLIVAGAKGGMDAEETSRFPRSIIPSSRSGSKATSPGEGGGIVYLKGAWKDLRSGSFLEPGS